MIFLFLGIFFAGNNLLYKLLGSEIAAEITRTRASTDYKEYLPYKFTVSGSDFTGATHGYAGERGNTIEVEYLVPAPWWNRIVGSARKEERWHWFVLGIGLIFTLVGIHSLTLVKKK